MPPVKMPMDLLKPIDAADLKTAVKKVEEKIHSQQGHANIENLLENIKQPSALQKIALPNRDGFEFVEVSHIIYC
jgi:two-component system LytT family response regulator